MRREVVDVQQKARDQALMSGVVRIADDESAQHTGKRSKPIVGSLELFRESVQSTSLLSSHNGDDRNREHLLIGEIK
jgi:hypothetical protein